eukprot:5524174-Amphidinium_carterae.1
MSQELCNVRSSRVPRHSWNICKFGPNLPTMTLCEKWHTWTRELKRTGVSEKWLYLKLGQDH